VQDAATGTKTDTPLIEVPSTVNVLNRQQLDAQQLLTLPEALQWVPGVFDQNSRSGFDRFTIRGFFAGDSVFLDGLRADPRFWISQELFGMERIEVLKGPASVLYGQIAPGGVVNLVSKRPRFEPHYDLGLTIGSYDFYEGTFDLGGAVNADKTIAVRATGLYLDRNDFVDFVEKQRAYFAPAVTFKLGTDTTLTVLGSYVWEDWVAPLELPAEGTVLPNPNGKIPIERFVGEPAFNRTEDWRFQGGIILEHRFNKDLRLRSIVRGQYYEVEDDGVRGFELSDDKRTMTRFVSGGPVRGWSIGADTNVEWTFQTGPVSHRVLGGVDVFYDYFNNQFYFGDDVGPLDLFAPVYGSPVAKGAVVHDATDTITQVGLYVQDQMKLFDKLTLVLGGRYDLAWHQQDDHLFNAVTEHDDTAFTYRAGLLYQFIPGLAVYASYATSFQPVTFGARANGAVFEPETGEQVEGGIKVDMFGGRLTSTVSVYHLTRQNVTVDDPSNEGFSIQTGEQRSQGVEVSAQARIVDGWDVTAFYAYTDGEITEDTTFAVGNQLPNTPKHSAGLWTSWTFPSGPLKGLGAGAGFRYVGERPADLSNAVTLPDYVVVDAAVFYRRGRLSLDLNFKNVTNETYFNGNGSSFIFPGEPFTVLGRVGWSF
jgi:iron complex outermembrane receptor protein